MNETEQMITSINELAGMFSRLFVNQMKKIMDENGLSKSQMFSLMHMNHHGHCGISQMADQLGTTDAASSQMVQRLVNMGLVKRIESPEDRRAKQISLTEKGKQIVGKMVENRHELIENIVKNLPPEKQQSTIEAITLLVQSARAYENNMIQKIEKE